MTYNVKPVSTDVSLSDVYVCLIAKESSVQFYTEKKYFKITYNDSQWKSFFFLYSFTTFK